MSSRPTFLLSAIFLSVLSRASEPAVQAQVLLQGPDPEALASALIAAGGSLTHRLPIINAVGGIINSDAIDVLAEHPNVNRVIEDLNPPKDPEQRACDVAGDLDILTQGNEVRWGVHNFADSPRAINNITLSWPQSAGSAELSIEVDQQRTSLGIMELSSNARALSLALPPGRSELGLRFPDVKVAPGQNDLQLSLELKDCSATLPKAYTDNHGDFYFPSVVGATLLQEAGLSGDGVTVAILDSGLWNHHSLTHNSLGEGRVPDRYNAILDASDEAMVDLGGHGSHMASIIANSEPVSRDGGQGFKGIAPNAKIIPVKAFAEAGDGDFLDIVRGIQWVVDNRERLNIRVLNMSLSASPRFRYWDDPINQAVLKAWQAGIVVVAAAGNDGPEWSTVGSPGNNPYVITVGAVTDSWTPDDRSDDYIPDFSSRGPTPVGLVKPDVVAPGGHITGLIPPGSRLARENPNFILQTGEFVSTGSSQAAAVVSGVIALLLEANPTLTNDEVKCLITTSAEPAINIDGRLAYTPFTQGSGYVNAGRALTLGEKQCEQQQLDIDAAVAGTEKLYGPAEKLEDGNPIIPGMMPLISTAATEKGPSESRRWGVREHLDRLDPSTQAPQSSDVPVDWAAILEREQQKLEALSKPPAAAQHP